MPQVLRQATGSVTATGVIATCDLALLANGGAAVQLTGTWVGTVTFQATIDGTNWVSILATDIATGSTATTATANSIYKFDVVGLRSVRANCTAYTSGTIVATINGLAG